MYCFGYFCRICVHNTKKLITLDIVLSDKNISLYQMMMEIKPELLQLDVIIPKYICIKCQKDLITSYNFHKRCQRAYENINKYIAKLNTIIHNPIKMITSESNKPFQFGYNEVTSRHMLFKIKKLTTQRLKSKKSNFKSLSVRSNLTAISTNYSKTVSNTPTLILQNAQQFDLNNTIQKLVKSINIPNLDESIVNNNLCNSTLERNNLNLKKTKCAIDNIEKTDQNIIPAQIDEFTDQNTTSGQIDEIISQNNQTNILKQISPQNELTNIQNNLKNGQITNQNEQKTGQTLDQNDLIDLDKMFYETFNITDDYFIKEENALDLGSCDLSDTSSSSINLKPLLNNNIKSEIKTEFSKSDSLDSVFQEIVNDSTDIETQLVDLLPPTALKKSNFDNLEQTNSNNFEVKVENILANITNNNFVDCSSSSNDENYHNNILNPSNCSKIIACIDLTIFPEAIDNLSEESSKLPDEINISTKISDCFNSKDIISDICIDLNAPKNFNRTGQDCKMSSNVQDVSKNLHITSTVRADDCTNFTVSSLKNFNNIEQISKILDSEMTKTNLDFELTSSHTSKIIPKTSKSETNADISNSRNYCEKFTNKSFSKAKSILNEDISDFNNDRSKIYRTNSCSGNTVFHSDDIEISNYGINGNIDDYFEIKKNINIFKNLLNLNKSMFTVSETSLSPEYLKNETEYDIDTNNLDQYKSFLGDSVSVLNTSFSKETVYKETSHNNLLLNDNTEVLNTSILKEIEIKQEQIDEGQGNQATNLIVDSDYIFEHDYVYPNFYSENLSDTALTALTSENHLESELDIKEHSLSYNTDEMRKIKIEFEQILKDELKTDSISSKTDTLKLDDLNIEVKSCEISPILKVTSQNLNKRKLENDPSNFIQQSFNSEIIASTNLTQYNSSSKNTTLKVELEKTQKLLKAAHKTLEKSKMLLSKKLNNTISTSLNTQENVVLDSSSIISNSINAKTAAFKSNPNLMLRNVSTSNNIISKDSKFENSDIVSKLSVIIDSNMIESESLISNTLNLKDSVPNRSDLKIHSKPKKNFINSDNKVSKFEILEAKVNTKKMDNSDPSTSTIVNKLNSKDQTINKLNPKDQINQVNLKDLIVKNDLVKNSNPKDIESKNLNSINPEHDSQFKNFKDSEIDILNCRDIEKKNSNLKIQTNEKKINFNLMSPETLNSVESNFNINVINDPESKIISQKVQDVTNYKHLFCKNHDSQESSSKVEENPHLKHFASHDSQLKNMNTKLLETKNTKFKIENKNTGQSNHLSSINSYSKESSLNDNNSTDPNLEYLVPKNSKIKNNVFKASESENISSVTQKNKYRKEYIDLKESQSVNPSSKDPNLNQLNPIEPDFKNISDKSKDSNSNCIVLNSKTNKSSNKLNSCKKDRTNSNILVISSNYTVPKNVDASKVSTSKETNVFAMYSCRYCAQTFKSRFEIKVHIFNRHKEMYNECQKCCKTFSTLKKLNDHKRICYLDTLRRRHPNIPDLREINFRNYGHRYFEKFDHRFKPYESYSVRNANTRSDTVQFRNECFGSANTIRNKYHENEGISKLCCYCNINFYSEGELKHHYFSKHFCSYKTCF